MRPVALLVFGLLVVPALAAPGLVLADGSWELVDGLAARVDNDIITFSDIRGEIALRKLGGESDGSAPIRRVIVSDLIKRRLLVAEAKKLRMKAEPFEVGDRVKGIIAKIGGETPFRLALEAGSVTLSEVEHRVSEKIMVKKYVDLKKRTTYVPEARVRSFILEQSEVFAGKLDSEVRDEVREHLASRKFQAALTSWFDEQVARGRVVLIEE